MLVAEGSRRIVFAGILSQIRQLTPLIHLPVPAQSKVRTARRPFFAFSRGFYGASITCPLMCSYLCISQASPLSNRTISVPSATAWSRAIHRMHACGFASVYEEVRMGQSGAPRASHQHAFQDDARRGRKHAMSPHGRVSRLRRRSRRSLSSPRPPPCLA